MLYALAFIIGLAGGALGYRWLIRRAPSLLDEAARKTRELGE